MQARQYQLDQVNKVCELVSTKRKVLLQTPTGGGKTVMFSMIADRFVHNYLENSTNSVLILVHREELMEQARRTVKEMLDIDACLIVSGTKQFRVARVYIGMVESLVSRLDCFSNVGLVIIDEAHINSFNKVHNIFLEEFIIGVTATPISASKREPIKKYYNEIVTGPQINELIGMGYLSQDFTRCPKDIVDRAKFSLDVLKGDFNERQMADEYKIAKYVTNVVTQYENWCAGGKTVVFNVNIEHSKEVAKCLSFCGYNARHLASDNNHERKEIMKWFHDTEDAILCNVMVATVGFDEPTIRNVIINFSTLSLPKWLQTCGRGGRIIDDAWIEKNQKNYPYPVKKKSSFNVIDMGGNWAKFGGWSYDRDWDYIFNYPPSPGDGVAPVKTCPECDGLVHAAVRVCNLTNMEGQLCLHEFKKKTLKEQDMEEMILVTKGCSVDDLIHKNKSKYHYYTMLELGIEPVTVMYNTFGSNPSQEVVDKYFRMYYRLVCQWWEKTMAPKANEEDGPMEDIEKSGFHIRKAQNNFNSICIKNGINAVHTRMYDWDEEESKESKEDQGSAWMETILREAI